MTPRPPHARPDRPGLVILAVLVVVTCAGLIGTSLVASGGAMRRGAESSIRRAESRALALSGVRVLLAEIDAQRDALLGGAEPEVTRSVEVYRTPAGERAVVRLLAAEAGEVVTSEAARLDVNVATAEMLSAVPGISAAAADAIVAARPESGYQSVGDLVRVEGTGGLDAAALALLTVFACDPEVEAGVEADWRGHARLNLAGPWSDSLSESIERRWGREARDAVHKMKEAGTAFDSLGALIDVLGVNSPLLGRVLDAVKVHDGAHATGRVDLSRAPAEVLGALPGIGAGAAESLVEVRRRLSEDELRSITWPLKHGVLDRRAFDQCARWLAPRSMQWRVRVEAGFASTAGEDRLSAAELRDGVDADTAPLADRVVYEMVIDGMAEPARIAYLREVTLEEAWGVVAAELAALGPVEGEPEGEPADATAPTVAQAEPSPAGAAAPVGSTLAGPRIGRWIPSAGPPLQTARAEARGSEGGGR